MTRATSDAHSDQVRPAGSSLLIVDRLAVAALLPLPTAPRHGLHRRARASPLRTAKPRP